MPIPPVEAQTAWFEAGPIRIGVEYRLLTDAVAASNQLAAAAGDERGQTSELDDRGVALHVCGEQDGEWREFLRFDCFVEDPHYHYVSWRAKANEMIHLDPVAADHRSVLVRVLVVIGSGAIVAAGAYEKYGKETGLPHGHLTSQRSPTSRVRAVTRRMLW